MLQLLQMARKFSGKIATLVMFCSACELLIVGSLNVAHGANRIDPSKPADELFARGRYAEASDAYELLARQAKTNRAQAATALFKQGLCQLIIHQPTVAFDVWNKLRTFYPESSLVPQTLLIEAQQTQSSATRFRIEKDLLARYPRSLESATVLTNRAQVAYEANNYGMAAIDLQQVIDQFPQHPDIERIRQKLEVLRLAAAGQTNVLSELTCEDLLARANALFDQAAFKEASRFYQQALKSFPTGTQSGRAAARLARCQIMVGRKAEALDTLCRLAVPTQYNAPEILADLVIQLASEPAADPLREQATRLLVERYPQSFATQQALFIAGSVAWSRRNKIEAQQKWDELRQLYPQSVFLAAVNRALKLTADMEAPRGPKASKKAGIAAQRALQRQRLNEEVRDLETAYVHLPTGSDSRLSCALRLAHGFALQGRHEQALQLCRQVEADGRQSGKTDVMLLETAQVLLQAGKTRLAKEQMHRLIVDHPQSSLRPLALYCLGNREILYEGRRREAWTYFAQLLAEYPAHPLSERARQFWAKISKLTEAQLQQQVLNFNNRVKTERI